MRPPSLPSLPRLAALAAHPLVILATLGIGVLWGVLQPRVAANLAVVSDIYVDLLRMVVLPFMVSAIIFSLQRLLHNGGAGAVVRRTAAVFAATLAGVAVLAFVAPLLLGAAGSPDAEQIEAFGQIVGHAESANDTQITLFADAPPRQRDIVQLLRNSLVPTNIFAALSQGDTLKSLVFALLFGLAIGHIGHASGQGFNRGLEAVYLACQQLTRWLNLPLPLVLVCMAASQVAQTGLGALGTMLGFLLQLALGSVLVVALAVLLLWLRSRGTLRQTLVALQTPIALALATRSSASCMPAMSEALCQRLGFERTRVELLVPLATPLLRTGPLLYYVAATLFVAQLYGRVLSPGDLLLVAMASTLAACASAGMTGVVTVSLTSLVCAQLGLPFEAAFVLLMAVDPVCDMLRTVVLVVGNMAAVSLVCDRPLPATATAAQRAPAAEPAAPAWAPHDSLASSTTGR